MQLFGPRYLKHLPAMPPGAMQMPDPWFVMTVMDLPVLGHAHDRWGLAELTEPTACEWVELAHRLCVPFSDTDYAIARAVADDATNATMEEWIHLPSGDRLSRPAGIAMFVQRAQQECRKLLPPGQAYAVDGLGTIGRVIRIRWEE